MVWNSNTRKTLKRLLFLVLWICIRKILLVLFKKNATSCLCWCWWCPGGEINFSKVFLLLFLFLRKSRDHTEPNSLIAPQRDLASCSRTVGRFGVTGVWIRATWPMDAHTDLSPCSFFGLFFSCPRCGFKWASVHWTTQRRKCLRNEFLETTTRKCVVIHYKKNVCFSNVGHLELARGKTSSFRHFIHRIHLSSCYSLILVNMKVEQ